MGFAFPRCQIPDCDSPGTITLVRARNRKAACDFVGCATHIAEVWNSLFSDLNEANCNDDGMKTVEFDVNVVVCDALSWQAFLYLRESTGTRWIRMAIGVFEALAMIDKIRGVSHARPTTHESMLNIVHSLGGEIESIYLDGFDYSNDCYLAKLRIREITGTIRVLDLRPSDAITVALFASSPILGLAELGKDASVFWKGGGKGGATL